MQKLVRSSLALAVTVILVLGSLSVTARAATLYETTTDFGAIVTPSGSSANYVNFLAFPFEVTATTPLGSIGGNFAMLTFLPVGNGLVFGAVVALSGPTDVPDSFDLSTPDVLGAATFAPPLVTTAPDASATVGADLALSLAPGWYALVFGSGLFGASTSLAGALVWDPSFDPLAPPSGTPWFFGSVGGASPSWSALQDDGDRFYVFASTTPLPEPAQAFATVLGLASVALARRGRRA